ncbi:MAG: hypothetical protein AAF417_19430 [Pseudomonadota bacterium]
MSEPLDPVVLQLFEEKEETLPEAHFLIELDARVSRRTRRILLTRIALIAFALLLEVLLGSPVRHSVVGLSDAASATLYSTDNRWLDYLLSPVNSIAGMLGALLVGAHVLHRRLRG